MQVTSTQHERQSQELSRRLTDPVLRRLGDRIVTDLHINADGRVFERRLDSTSVDTGIRFTPEQVFALIMHVAGMVGAAVTESRPFLEGKLPFDSEHSIRLTALVPPLSPEGPTLSLRLHRTTLVSLEDYISQGVLSPEQAEYLHDAVKARKAILISGATGAGKTTVANTLLDLAVTEIPTARVVIIEDTRELMCHAGNKLFLLTSAAVDMTGALKVTLRLAPDRIVVGEVRDGAALAMAKAFTTGHPGGLSTIHAQSCEGALIRLDALIQEAGVPSQPVLIGHAIQVVVQMSVVDGKRRVTEIVEVEPGKDGYRLTGIS